MPDDQRRLVRIELLPQELDTIYQGLGQLPYFQVVNLIGKLQMQLKAALEAEDPAKTPPTEG